jgi:hypothetical protein
MHASISVTYVLNRIWALVAAWTLLGHFFDHSFLKNARLEAAEVRFAGTDLLIARRVAK